MNQIKKYILTLLSFVWMFTTFAGADNHKWVPISVNEITTFVPFHPSAEQTEEHTVIHNTIRHIEAHSNANSLVLSMQGDFEAGSHPAFFIDSDNDPNTGYTRGVIKGADYLIEDGKLYYYGGIIDNKSWNWKEVTGIEYYFSAHKITCIVPLHVINIGSQINYIADIANQGWSEHVVYANMMQIRIHDNMKQVMFDQTPYVLKNPLKGFMIWPDDTTSPKKYVSMYKAVINWNQVENSEDDGVEKIKEYSNGHIFWHPNNPFPVESRNIKVNPEIVIKRSSHNDDFSPADMDISEHDNQTDLFGDRAANLAKKLAQAWDNDPRIGFVYMGMVGMWGEQTEYWRENNVNHSRHMKPNVATKLAQSFTKYFKHKKVMVRLPNYYDKNYLERHDNIFLGDRYSDYFRFGMYWDAFSWQHEDGDETDNAAFETGRVIRDSKLWVDQPILGEVAFNVPNHNIYTEDDYREEYQNLDNWERSQMALHNTLKNPEMVDYLIDYIRMVHATGLSWISNYNENDPQEAAAAAKLQKAMGYRFVVTKATYDDVINGGKFKVALDVKNVGSAPFYYDWPMQIALLDQETKEVVYRAEFDTDIRKWLPGDEWDSNENRYKIPPKTYHIEQEFTLPEDLEEKDYILAVEIDDPAGMAPSIRFANTNYYRDGRMPIGMVGIGEKPTDTLPKNDNLDDDSRIRYAYDHENNRTTPRNQIEEISATNTKSDLTLSMRGSFVSGSHFDFYIDTDGDDASGYSNGTVKGADYLIEDGVLYRYPDGASGWNWSRVSDIRMNSTSTQSHAVVPFERIGLNENGVIRFTASEASPDWKEKTFYPEMQRYALESSENSKVKIFAIGDSTVYNREVYENGKLMELGWADRDALGTYMKNPNNLFDEGRSGASSKTYKIALDKRHDWEETKELIKKSDLSNGAYLLIQFGHNDESQDSSVGTTIDEFKNELAVYVGWARDNGLVPVLITPVERRAKIKGQPNNRTHHLANGDYAQAVRDLAKDKDVALLDLEERSWNEYNKYEDTEAINRIFAYDDNTHFSPKGAKLVAGWVKELICQSNAQDLCAQFK